jgi:hypothetical protein
VRTRHQLDAALEVRPASITLDYLDLYGLRPAVERIQAAGLTARVASPRVLKPQEQRIVHFLLRLDCEIVVRSGGLLEALQGRHPHALIGDFSLNAANQISAETYFGLGIERLTPTHDLNADQIARLARAIGGERFEVIAYHHLPVFHTEHCVFCRDIGWRKPDRRIFVEALCRFGCAPGDALFVGDRLDWDIQGAVDAGIRALLIDRDAKTPAGSTLTSLRDLLTLLA